MCTVHAIRLRACSVASPPTRPGSGTAAVGGEQPAHRRRRPFRGHLDTEMHDAPDWGTRIAGHDRGRASGDPPESAWMWDSRPGLPETVRLVCGGSRDAEGSQVISNKSSNGSRSSCPGVFAAPAGDAGRADQVRATNTSRIAQFGTLHDRGSRHGLRARIRARVLGLVHSGAGLTRALLGHSVAAEVGISRNELGRSGWPWPWRQRWGGSRDGRWRSHHRSGRLRRSEAVRRTADRCRSKGRSDRGMDRDVARHAGRIGRARTGHHQYRSPESGSRSRRGHPTVPDWLLGCTPRRAASSSPTSWGPCSDRVVCALLLATSHGPSGSESCSPPLAASTRDEVALRLRSRPVVRRSAAGSGPCWCSHSPLPPRDPHGPHLSGAVRLLAGPGRAPGCRRALTRPASPRWWRSPDRPRRSACWVATWWHDDGGGARRCHGRIGVVGVFFGLRSARGRSRRWPASCPTTCARDGTAAASAGHSRAHRSSDGRLGRSRRSSSARGGHRCAPT